MRKIKVLIKIKIFFYFWFFNSVPFFMYSCVFDLYYFLCKDLGFVFQCLFLNISYSWSIYIKFSKRIEWVIQTSSPTEDKSLDKLS